MYCSLRKLAGSLILAVLSGCVSKGQYNDISNSYQMVRQQISKCEKQVGELHHKVSESERAADLCREETAALENRIVNAGQENQLLTQKIETLNQSVKQKDTVISLQGTIIRLFDDSKQTLQTSLKEQMAAQGIEAEVVDASPMKVVLINKLLYRSGSAVLSPDGKALLEKLSGLMEEKPYFIRVQGHTDDRPLKSTARYPTNWELSAARATSVIRFLQETVGIAPDRMSATGFGPYRPIASNETPEGRSQNRRIEIILETTSNQFSLDNQ